MTWINQALCWGKDRKLGLCGSRWGLIADLTDLPPYPSNRRQSSLMT